MNVLPERTSVTLGGLPVPMGLEHIYAYVNLVIDKVKQTTKCAKVRYVKIIGVAAR